MTNVQAYLMQLLIWHIMFVAHFRVLYYVKHRAKV